jgi:hypothetical protein
MLSRAMARAARFVALAAALFVVIVTTACSLVVGARPRAEWTVLVYMAADNNLEDNALVNLEEMAAVGSTADVHVVAQVARSAGRRAKRGVVDMPAWSTTKRIHVEADHLEELGDLGRTNMADPVALTSFITWATAAYPARRYALVLWDHGAGWSGFGADSASSATMSVPDIARAICEAGVKLTLVGFDACLMSALEVAFELDGLAGRLVASEEMELAHGWDYTTVLRALVREPAMSGERLASMLAATYVEKTRRFSLAASRYITMSVVDLTRVAPLKRAFRDFVVRLREHFAPAGTSLADNLVGVGRFFGEARSDTPAFGRQGNVTDPGVTFDLGRLLDNTMARVSDAAVRSSAARLRLALRAAVVASAVGDGFRDADIGGISLFIPVGLAQSEEALVRGRAYDGLPGMRDTLWPELVREIAEAATKDRQRPEVARPTLDSEKIVAGRSVATLSGSIVDDTAVAGVVVGVVRLVEGRPSLVAFDEQRRTYARRHDYAYRFDGMAWYLSGAPDPVFTVQWRPGQRAVFGRYTHADGARPTNAYFVFDEASGQMIHGFDVMNGAFGALLPTDASLLEPSVFTLDLGTGSMRDHPSDAVAVRGAVLRRGPLPGGRYLLSVTAFDLASNSATNGAFVTVESPGAAAATTRYEDPRRAFAIARPSGWRVRQSPDGTTAFYLDDPDEGTSFSILPAAGADGHVSAWEVWSASLDDSRKQYPDMTTVSEQRQTLPGTATATSVEAVYTWTSARKEPMRGWATLSARPDDGAARPTTRILFISYQAPAATFDAVRDVFVRMLQTLEMPAAPR